MAFSFSSSFFLSLSYMCNTDPLHMLFLCYVLVVSNGKLMKTYTLCFCTASRKLTQVILLLVFTVILHKNPNVKPFIKDILNIFVILF